MSYRAVMKGKEYWRLGTSIFLFDLDNPLDAYTLVSISLCGVSTIGGFAALGGCLMLVMLVLAMLGRCRCDHDGVFLLHLV